MWPHSKGHHCSSVSIRPGLSACATGQPVQRARRLEPAAAARGPGRALSRGSGPLAAEPGGQRAHGRARASHRGLATGTGLAGRWHALRRRAAGHAQHRGGAAGVTVRAKRPLCPHRADVRLGRQRAGPAF